MPVTPGGTVGAGGNVLSAGLSVMETGESDDSVNRKILIVEDDASTASYLVKGLAEAGYAPDQVDALIAAGAATDFNEESE